MDTLEQLEAAFRRLEADLPAILLRQTEVAANDIMALVDTRLTETGKDASGTDFVAYTPRYRDFKSGVTSRKSAAGKAKRRAKADKATAVSPVGRFTGFVNFNLTGQMLASTQTGLKNINTKSKEFSGTTAIVIIGPLDEETRKKVEGNSKKRPGFLNPSKAEVERIEKIRQGRIEEMIREEYFA